MNWKDCETKLSWATLRQYPSICWEGLTKLFSLHSSLQAKTRTWDLPNTKEC
jgi:hypothetical protein